MRTSILVALMAANALIPGAALAQRMERSEENAGRANRQAQVEARSERRAERPDGGTAGGWNRGDRGGGDRGGGDRGGGRGFNRQDQAPAPQPQAQRPQQQQPQAQAQFDPDRTREGRPGRRGGNGAGQWGGNRGGDGQTVTVDRRGDGNSDWRNGNRGGNWRDDGNRGGAVRGSSGWSDGRRNGWNGNSGRDDRGGWNRDWRRDSRYDWNSRRQFNRNAFHLPRYYAPRGWNYGYRRLNIGFTLSAGLFGNNYWIGEPDYYGLPDAYGPYRWVRYYNDALLVDIYSGQVVDTVYDIFW